MSKMISDHAKKVPIFWGHGTADPIVPFDRATMSVEFMETQLGISKVTPEKIIDGGVEFHPYVGLQHSADPEEIKDLQMFISIGKAKVCLGILSVVASFYVLVLITIISFLLCIAML